MYKKIKIIYIFRIPLCIASSIKLFTTLTETANKIILFCMTDC